MKFLEFQKHRSNACGMSLRLDWDVGKPSLLMHGVDPSQLPRGTTITAMRLDSMPPKRATMRGIARKVGALKPLEFMTRVGSCLSHVSEGN